MVQSQKTPEECYNEVINQLISCLGSIRKVHQLETAGKDPMSDLLEAEDTARTMVQQIRQEIKAVCKRQFIPEPKNTNQWYENQRESNDQAN